MNIKNALLAISLISCHLITHAQTGFNTVRTINWVDSLHDDDKKLSSVGFFEGCFFNENNNQLFPMYFERIPISNPNSRVRLTILSSEKAPFNNQSDNIKRTISLKQFVTYTQGKPILNIEFSPLFLSNNRTVERLKSFSYSVYTENQSNQPSKLKKATTFKTTSVLNQGDWFRFSITNDGLYKITGAQLKASGANLSGIGAKTIKVFGFQGGPLPEDIPTERHDDLIELPVELVDANGNNQFDDQDFVRFYAEGANTYNFTNNRFVHEQNVYSTKAYIYITFGGSNAKQLSNYPSGSGSSFEKDLDFFYDLIHREKEEVNLIQSGRHWYGDEFRVEKTKVFTHNFSDVKTSLPAILSHRFVGRSIKQSASCVLSVNGQPWHDMFISSVPGDYDETFGQILAKNDSFNLTSNTVSLRYQYNIGGEGNGWIDFYSLSVPVKLQLTGNQKIVRSSESQKYNSTQFSFSGSDYTIWNVTDISTSGLQQTFTDGNFRRAILSNNKTPQQFVLFKPGSEAIPEFDSKVENQNLHQVIDVDFIIISHSSFLAESERLASLHRKEYNQNVLVVDCKKIYHEFSGGRQDPVAIREFIRMHYSRGLNSGTPLENVLLMGDGSYDYLNRIEGNTNFIPTFQSRNTTNPVNSYSSDDFYAILDDTEGYYDISLSPEDIDIGVGRIPCRSVEQAKTMVDKIIRYHDPVTFGDWQNTLTFLGDDEDGSRHLDDSETMTKYVRDQEPVFNINKIYLDAYQQESFGSGEKYPDVNVAVTKAFEKGTLVFNYLGHGGTSGMAHERVVTRDEIRSWNNFNQLPLMVTATCELSRFDDPAQDSPGELMLFNQNGGAIGLVTTMRLVQISLNTNLSRQIWNDNLVNLTNGPKDLGTFFRDTKNATQRDVNQRNFSLLADPAMELAIPKYEVITTHINDSIIGSQLVDSLKAFAQIKLKGEVRKPDNTLASDFNGFVYPTIFDKFLNYQSLGNDETSYIRTYQLQNSVLYRGKVSVTNGKFSFQFVVPKDISYNFGAGKISYFADNGVIDAHGYDTSIIVGGSITDVADDQIGPNVELLLDDESWVFGGTTNSSPLLIAKVFDQNGINTVGNGIGRDITAIIDAGTEDEQIIVLNDFYQSKLDSYQEGEIRYQMEGISPGKHTLKVRVWDVYNNASEDETEFIVASDENLALNHVLNFPNPFTSSTVFHFDHNKSGMQMDVLIQVVTTTGRIVKTFHYSSTTASSHFDHITWDGKDEFGDQLARGVYLYKLTVKTEDGDKADVTQKLVILK